jgi:Flp pilus assembly protein TadD
LTYADVKKRAKEIAKVTLDRAMPPWLPEAGYGEFKEERRLSEEEIRLIQDWFTKGAMEGDTADLPPLPRWSEGWQLGQPDLVLKIPEPYRLQESGRDVWRTFVIPAPLRTRRYVRAMEFRPGNKCVHHAVLRLDRTPQSRLRDESDPGLGFGGITLPDTARPPAGHMLNWLPGRSAYKSPEGLAWPFEKGADFLVQLHMQITGKPEIVQPTIGFYFTDQPPTNHLSVLGLMVRTIDIPAGATEYKIQDSYKLPVDVQVLWINPHAHYLGKEMKGYARLPDGTQKWLFLIKQWDFNWQGDYSYREPVFLPRGTEVSMEYTYDNSDGNPRNPSHPPRRMQYGQQSTDEMGELWIQVLTRNPKDRVALERDFELKTLTEMTTYYGYRLKLDANDARAHCRLGFAKSSLGKPDEAIEHFRRAIELNASDDESHLHLGIVWLNQERYSQAQNEFETALRLNPKNYLAHGHLGLVHMNQGHLRDAETHLRAALRLNPNDATAQENLKRVMDAIGTTHK